MANRIQLGLIVDTLVEISTGKFASAPVVGASVTIKKRTGAGAVEVYEHETGEVAIVPTTDSNGRIKGWAKEGAYVLTVTGGTPYIAATEYAWDALSGRGIEHLRVGEESIWRSDLRKDENPNDATSVLEALVPTGTFLDFGGTVAPPGYLLTDGKAYSTETYARLFGVIGYTFGKPKEKEFNVPNTLGRVRVGAGAGAGLTVRILGAKEGTETVTLTEKQMPSHKHQLATEEGTPLNVPWVAGGNPNPSNANISSTNGYNNGFVFTTYVGENEAHSNMQPFIVACGIIKT